MPDTDNKHYIHHITQMGEHHPLVTTEHVFSNKGVKLISSGTHVNASFYNKLLKHKLLKPLDQSLSDSNILTPEKLSQIARTQLQQNNLLKNMQKDSGEHHDIAAIIGSLNIEDILLFKLTVLQKQLPDIFQHCLGVAIAAIYLALKLEQDEQFIKTVAIAGLFHDIGLLHLEPDIFHHEGELNEDQLKQIYSHPVIAGLILKALPGYQAISQAVLEHHERMDGSGYPQGVVAEKISLAGQVLIVAELGISLTEKNTGYCYKNKLQAILKFNNQQYPKQLIDILLRLLKTINTDITKVTTISKEEFINKISAIWVVLNAWDKNHNEGIQVPQSIHEYITSQVEKLVHALTMSGLTLDNISLADEELDEILGDDDEMQALIDEAIYQVKNVVKEITRRWPEWSSHEDTETSVTSWLKAVDGLLKKTLIESENLAAGESAG